VLLPVAKVFHPGLLACKVNLKPPHTGLPQRLAAVLRILQHMSNASTEGGVKVQYS
jgi:hypothetical protein